MTLLCRFVPFFPCACALSHLYTNWPTSGLIAAQILYQICATASSN